MAKSPRDPCVTTEPPSASEARNVPGRGPPRWVIVGGIAGVVFTMLWVALHHGAFASHGPAQHDMDHVQP